VTRRRRVLAIAAVVLAAALAYAPSLFVPFQYDDYARIGENRALAEGRLFDALLWLGNSRVVPSLTLVVNHRIGGLEPFGYHVVNFAVHLLATFGVMALAIALCGTPRLRARWADERWTIAGCAGLVFACHPLQTQAVTYIIQRYASMAALFYVWSVVCYVRGRTARHAAWPGTAYFAGAAALAVCGVLSKENAVSVPAAWLLVEWIGFGWPRRRRAVAVGIVVGLLAFAIPLGWKLLIALPPRLQRPGVPWLTRLAYALAAPRASETEAVPGVADYLRTETAVLPRYLLLVFRPWGLNVDPDTPIATSFSPPVLLGIALLVALAALAITQVRRRPFLAFALLWWLIALSVESSVIPIVDPMVEHRMYLPLAGFAIGAGALYAALVRRAPRLVRAGAAGIAVALVVLTFARNLVWQSPVTLWLDAADKSPHKARPQLNLAVAYHLAGDVDAAAVHYCRALALNPQDALTRSNLEIAMESLGAAAHVAAEQPDGTIALELEEPEAFCARRTAAR
jgi:hypothetical protein